MSTQESLKSRALTSFPTRLETTVKARMHGFTLVELGMTLLVASIFMAYVIPNYYSTIQNNKVVNVVNKLVASVHYTKIEAVKRGVRVAICPAASSALNQCSSGTSWAQGWIVFIDPDRNNRVNTTTEILKVQEALPTGTNIVTSSNIVSFNGSGFLDSTSPTFNISASGCKGQNARQVNVSSSGRVSLLRTNCT